MTLAVGVDVGGTKLSAAQVDETGAVGPVVQVVTPPAEALNEALVALVTPLVSGEVAAVGVCVAGFVDADLAGVTFAPNIPGWAPRDLRFALSARLRRPVVLENDANAAAWGEAVRGAGRGIRDLVCLTVGTGLGGGLVLHGALHRGAWGFAAEYGHMNLVPNGRSCSCGQRGCWERYVSGGVLVTEAMAAAADRPESATILRRMTKGSHGPTGQEVMLAAQLGDEASVNAYRTVGHALGLGLAQLAAVLDPACFVVGGGVSEAGELLLGPARAAFEQTVAAGGDRPLAAVTAAELGNYAGIVGAADLALRALKS